jgi:hypothetical protein
VIYTASYDPADNKLRLRVSERLDAETFARVKAAGFSWAPRQQLFVAGKWTPAREDLLIELAGDIGDEETTLAERAEARAERFDTYSAHREQDAEAAARAVSQITDGIPLGQPILIGHHSQRRAERDAKKIENGTRKAAKMWETAAYWLERAEGAIAHAEFKELPRVRLNRIKTIETDKRRQERSIKDAEKFMGLWNKTEDIELARAVAIANYDHISFHEAGEKDWTSLWAALKDGLISPEDARTKALRAHERTIAWARRWIDHYDNRLVYERAMLAASGYEEPAKTKKPTRAALPLLNYKAESIIASRFFYDGKSATLPIVEMTKAEFAKIPADYKSTRVIDGTHRYRVAMRSGGLFGVFLTDSKAHDRPEPKAAS